MRAATCQPGPHSIAAVRLGLPQVPESSASESLPSTASFEQQLAALERIAQQLESGEIGLGESLALYEEGVRLLKQCQAMLERAERRIEIVTSVDASGVAVVEPFEAPSEALEQKLAARGQRRSRGKRSDAASTAAESSSASESAASGPAQSAPPFGQEELF